MDNTAGAVTAGYGPGVQLLSSGGTIVADNIVAFNVGAPPGAGGLDVYQSPSLLVTGNILHANSPQDFASDEGPLPPGNLIADPLFVDAPNGDYRLLPGSPAIDSSTMGVAERGTPASASIPVPTTRMSGDLLTWSWSEMDVAQNPRLVDGDMDGMAIADRGCIEYFETGERHVYRSTISAVAAGDYGSCQDPRDTDLTDNRFLEPDLPPPGQAFTFLVTLSPFPGTESSLGTTSAGVDRVPSTICP